MKRSTAREFVRVAQYCRVTMSLWLSGSYMYMRCCLRDCRREQNQNGRWGEKGGCDAGKGVSERAVRHARRPLDDRPTPTSTSPAPQLPENACHVHHSTMKPFWLEQPSGKNDLRYITHRLTKHVWIWVRAWYFRRLFRCIFKSNKHSSKAKQ